MSNLINITDKKNLYLLKLIINNCDVSLVNAIRRIILSDVPSIGVRTEPYNESDVKIIENTSSLHNEFIMHRLGMVPIDYSNIDEFDPSKYLFKLKKHNTTTKEIILRTNDIEIHNIDTGNLENNLDFFKPDDFTKDHIVLLKLKPNPNNKGEQIDLEFTASISNGREHAGWSPVSCVTYNNMVDEDKYEAALKLHLNEKTDANTSSDELKKIKHSFSISERERYFITDDRERPNTFEFTIESCGSQHSHIILYKSLDILKNKIIFFNQNLIDSMTKYNEFVEITESIGVMKAFDINIQNENHTLGYLIQSYIEKLYSDSVSFVGYKNPHPLKSNIIIRIGIETKEEAINVVSNTCSDVIKIIEQLINEIETDFKIKLKQTKKIKKLKVTSD